MSVNSDIIHTHIRNKTDSLVAVLSAQLDACVKPSWQQHLCKYQHLTIWLYKPSKGILCIVTASASINLTHYGQRGGGAQIKKKTSVG